MTRPTIDDARRTPAVPTTLVPLAERLRTTCPDLGSPLVRPWTEDPLLLLDRGTPWLVAPVERDPHRRDGQTVMPRRQIRQLSALARRDLPISRLAIAHELRPDGPVRDLIPELRNGPRTCTDDVARVVAGPLPAHPTVCRVVRLLDRAVGTATRVAGNGLGRLLDPILFGVVAPEAPEPGDPCLWLPLLAWEC